MKQLKILFITIGVFGFRHFAWSIEPDTISLTYSRIFYSPAALFKWQNRNSSFIYEYFSKSKYGLKYHKYDSFAYYDMQFIDTNYYNTLSNNGLTLKEVRSLFNYSKNYYDQVNPEYVNYWLNHPPAVLHFHTKFSSPFYYIDSFFVIEERPRIYIGKQISPKSYHIIESVFYKNDSLNINLNPASKKLLPTALDEIKNEASNYIDSLGFQLKPEDFGIPVEIGKSYPYILTDSQLLELIPIKKTISPFVEVKYIFVYLNEDKGIDSAIHAQKKYLKYWTAIQNNPSLFETYLDSSEIKSFNHHDTFQ